MKRAVDAERNELEADKQINENERSKLLAERFNLEEERKKTFVIPPEPQKIINIEEVSDDEKIINIEDVSDDDIWEKIAAEIPDAPKKKKTIITINHKY
jgi:hypothetical protein